MAWPSLTAVATGPCSCCRRAKLLQPPGEVAEAAGPIMLLLLVDQANAAGPTCCSRAMLLRKALQTEPAALSRAGEQNSDGYVQEVKYCTR